MEIENLGCWTNGMSGELESCCHSACVGVWAEVLDEGCEGRDRF